MGTALPLELLRVVFELVDSRGTLITLLVVSRPISALVEPLLFKHVLLPGMPSPVFRIRSAGFHKRLSVDEGRLALCVNSLTTSVSTTSLHGQGLFSSLDDILSRLRNLRRLKLLYHWEPHIDFPTHSAVYYPFSLTHFASYNRFKRPAQFVAFLESQTSLEHLVISLFDEEVSLHPDALPNLRVLEAPPKFAFSVLPGRMVEHLILGSATSGEFIFDSGVKEALGRLHSLSCIASDVLPLSPWLERLEYLWLSLGKVGLLEEFKVYSALLQPPRLQYLRLSGFKPSPNQADVIDTFYDDHPSLRLIDIKRLQANVYGRYLPARSPPKLVEVSSATWDEWWRQAVSSGPPFYGSLRA
ncbi:hypothetical protein ONZ45_g18170 [Pleurotus djamor]|nr:hypothetical protein ONZ45_g18170 [Pleurotus djamor]